VAFGEALKPEFKLYAQQVIKNAQALAAEMIKRGYRIISGGTDNHLMVIDLGQIGLAGKEAEKILEKIGVSVSRSTIPDDPNPPLNPSGIRIGTPAVTTRGMKEDDMKLIASFIDEALKNKEDNNYLSALKEKVKQLCHKHPLEIK